MCKKFLSFSTDVYVIFCYWNISMKWMDFIFICHLLKLIYFLCGKYCTISILLLIIYWCWHIFHVQNVLIILDWCLCDFLLLKHIDEVDRLHLHLSLTYFLCGKYFMISILLLIIYWCWLFFMYKMFLSFLTDVYMIFCYWNILMKCTHFMLICHLLMLTYFLCGKYSTISILFLIIYWCWHIFHVQNVLIILDWCLCDFLLLKHIDEVHTLHVDLSFTDVDIFFVLKISRISILVLIIYWCWLFFMYKMFLSFLTDVYVSFCYWNISMKCTHFILICHLLMLTFFLCAKCSYHSQLIFMWFSCTKTYWWSGCTSSSFVIYCFWLFTDVDYFSCGKCSYHSWLMFMWFSVTETYRWSGWTSSLFVTYWCWHIFCVENIVRFQYCFWLFTDVDIFFMCKMFLSFSTDVYVIFCYWNISMKWMDFIFICHWHIFCVENILRFQYCFWLFTDVDIFFMCKMFLSFSTDVYVIFCYWNISMKWMDFIFICHWHIFCVENILRFQYCFWLFTDVDIFFMCKMFLSFSTDVYVIFCYWNILMKWMDFIFICHWHIFCVENILRFQYCFWLFTDVDIFFMCKMFLSFPTDVYVIFCYWNISIQCTYFIFICHLLMLTYFRVENVPQFQYC